MTLGTDPIPCRLCGAPSRARFSKQLLRKYVVTYLQCEGCASLQTETPYWLEESYADERRVLDTNAAARLQALQRTVYFVWRLFGFSPSARALDWGGGDGLFVRMLRDVGIDASSWDPYSENLYAAGFDGAPESTYGMITAFEVWEHLPEPGEELRRLFTMQPEVHLATTGLYTGQDENWGYLNPLTGRHVFFYSPRAVRDIAERYGYHCLIARNKLLVFYRRRLSRPRSALLRAVLRGHGTRRDELLFAFRRARSLAVEDQRRNQQRVLAGELWSGRKPGSSGT